MKNLFLSLLILAAPFIAYSQEGALERSNRSSDVFIGVPRDLIQKPVAFFKFLMKGEVENAYSVLLANSEIINKKLSVDKLISETNKSVDLYGEVKGYEPVSSEIITASYIRLRYISLNNKHPMRWIFTFYKSPEFGWLATNVQLDDMTEYFFSDD